MTNRFLRHRSGVVALAAALATVIASPQKASAYVEVPITLADVIKQSTNIVQMQVTKVDREKVQAQAGAVTARLRG